MKTTLLLLLLLVASVNAATHHAATCSVADINAAMALCSNGDTVTVDAGSCTWTTTLTVTKAITVQGTTITDSVLGTAVDNTVITDNVPLLDGRSRIIVLGAACRVTGFTFQAGARTSVAEDGAFPFTSAVSGARLDHCHFKPLYQRQISVCYDQKGSVIDHNLYEWYVLDISGWRGGQVALVFNANWGGHGPYGDGSWFDLTNWGGPDCMFVEDNYMKGTKPGDVVPVMDAYFGGRYVFRHNIGFNINLHMHGTEGFYRGGRTMEVYNNQFNFNTNAFPMGQLRSGLCLWHDNTWEGTEVSGQQLQTYRSFAAVSGFGGATGANGRDINDTEGDGTHIDGHASHVYDSSITHGAHVGVTGTDLIVTGTPWTVNQWAPGGVYTYTVHNLTTNYHGLILSNTANELVLYSYEGHPIFTAGDTWKIYRTLILADQPGRGKGDLASRDGGGVPSEVWLNDALEVCYSWANKFNPSGVNHDVNLNVGTQPAILVSGRDYKNDAMLFPYVPYCYPHPLVSGVPCGSATPTPTPTVTPTPTPTPSPTPNPNNYAHSAFGSVATASSVLNSSYPVTATNNGDQKGLVWATNGGWNDATPSAWPDWVQVEFSLSRTINEIDVFTLQDNYTSPITPTLSTTFSLYGITDFEVQYWDGSTWVDVTGGNVTGNNKVWRQFSFSDVTTTKIRVLVGASLGLYSRITEIEAYHQATSPTPTPTPSPTPSPTVTPTPTPSVTATPTPSTSQHKRDKHKAHLRRRGY